MSYQPILLYDGVCGLCNALVQFIIKRTGSKFLLHPLQSGEGQAFLAKFNLPLTDFSSVVFIKGDRYFLNSSAVLTIFREMGGIMRLLYVLIIIPRPVRDWLYRVIARNRYKIFGKINQCDIPEKSPNNKNI